MTSVIANRECRSTRSLFPCQRMGPGPLGHGPCTRQLLLQTYLGSTVLYIVHNQCIRTRRCGFTDFPKPKPDLSIAPLRNLKELRTLVKGESRIHGEGQRCLSLCEPPFHLPKSAPAPTDSGLLPYCFRTGPVPDRDSCQIKTRKPEARRHQCTQLLQEVMPCIGK